tara:strand:- start:856 stop:1809 length:954 start_codon:yes stop_codon:yes gene_type:complete
MFIKKNLWIFFKFLLSTSLTWYLLKDIEFKNIYQQAKFANPITLFLAFLLLLFHFVIVSWRWDIVLYALNEKLPFKKLLKISYISIFFNQVLPASIGGDVIRIYMIRSLKVSFFKAFNSTVIDRIASLISIAFMILLSTPFLINKVEDNQFKILIILATLLSLFGFFVLVYLDKFLYIFRENKLIKKFLLIYPDARRAFYVKRNFVPLFLVSTFGNLNLSMAIYFISKSLDIQISITECLILFPPVLLLSSIPISFAGWGVREGSMVTAFSFAGVDSNSALTVSIFFGLISILVNLPAGFLWASDKKILNDKFYMKN